MNKGYITEQIHPSIWEAVPWYWSWSAVLPDRKCRQLRTEQHRNKITLASMADQLNCRKSHKIGVQNTQTLSIDSKLRQVREENVFNNSTHLKFDKVQISRRNFWTKLNISLHASPVWLSFSTLSEVTAGWCVSCLS